MKIEDFNKAERILKDIRQIEFLINEANRMVEDSENNTMNPFVKFIGTEFHKQYYQNIGDELNIIYGQLQDEFERIGNGI